MYRIAEGSGMESSSLRHSVPSSTGVGQAWPSCTGDESATSSRELTAPHPKSFIGDVPAPNECHPCRQASVDREQIVDDPLVVPPDDVFREPNFFASAGWLAGLSTKGNQASGARGSHIAEEFRRRVNIGPFSSEENLRKFCAEGGASCRARPISPIRPRHSARYTPEHFHAPLFAR
jgi:hypothetical protein